MTQLEIEPETITELEATLIDRIRKMSIVEQYRLLQLINKSVPELIEVEREPIEKSPEPEISPLERQQKAVAILQDIANSGGLNIDDPVAWQREERKDRPLPGRED